MDDDADAVYAGLVRTSCNVPCCQKLQINTIKNYIVDYVSNVTLYTFCITSGDMALCDG